MSYLNLDENYFSHPKIIKLVGLLGIGAESLPLKLWCYCAKFSKEKGVLENVTAEEIKHICQWPGAATDMLVALLAVCCIERIKESCYKVHEWEDHQGHIIAFHLRAKVNAKKKWDQYRKEHASSIADSTASSSAGSNAPYLTLPNLTNINKSISNFHFDEIWGEYPNKLGKKSAERHFNSSVKNEQQWINIKKAIENFLNSKIAKGDPKFIPHGSTWFNNWQDWVNYQEPNPSSIKNDSQHIPHFSKLTPEEEKEAEAGREAFAAMARNIAGDLK